MKWQEFLQDEKGKASSGRLLQFMAFFPASAILIYNHTTEALGVYLTAFVLNGVGSKYLDVKGQSKPQIDGKNDVDA